MVTMSLDCNDAEYDSDDKTYTFPYNIYDGLKQCDNCVGKIPVSGGVLAGSAGVIVSTVSPYNITVRAGSGAGTFTVTKANPNVLTLST